MRGVPCKIPVINNGEDAAMGDIGKFSDTIQRRLFQHAKEKAGRLLQVESRMKQLLGKRESFNSAAYRILTSVIFPRMEELSKNFENSSIKSLDKVEGFQCICEFSPTERFPARVALDIVIIPGGYFERLGVHYNLEITPPLMEYKRYDGRTFDIDSPACEEEIGEWLEARLFDFIETYLQLETHPAYQQGNYVTDPVCNMKFPIAQAAGKIEKEGQTIYFCSELCKESFLKK